MIRMTKTDKKNNPDLSGKKENDERKKKLDRWSYYLAWFTFICTVGIAIIKVIKEWNPPNKDEHYK